MLDEKEDCRQKTEKMKSESNRKAPVKEQPFVA